MWKPTYVFVLDGASVVAGVAAAESVVAAESAVVAGSAVVVESGGFVPEVGRSEWGSSAGRGAWEAGCTA